MAPESNSCLLPPTSYLVPQSKLHQVWWLSLVLSHLLPHFITSPAPPVSLEEPVKFPLEEKELSPSACLQTGLQVESRRKDTTQSINLNMAAGCHICNLILENRTQKQDEPNVMFIDGAKHPSVF
ncbi:unnamed protein product [Pleuronectes platessa]|uniref:Uncharacterized protein n=1 Tax=Pleuronectes platessa TaxID=8262 RepID=A0A9N7VAM4_PLEPL|nr:unnamed protein product [Pleuronectes platessa]